MIADLEMISMRVTSKQELIERIEKEHTTFVALVRSIPQKRFETEGFWGNGWTVKDLLAHLTEWEQMFLRWYREGRDGASPIVPSPDFKWNQTPKLNRAIWLKNRGKSTRMVLAEFEASYVEILSVARKLSEDELFTPGHFAWTSQALLATYVAANTCSHYRTATNYIKRHLKAKPRKRPSASRWR